MKKWIVGMLMIAGISAGAGSLGLPVEHVALETLNPAYADTVEHLVCIWDASAGSWLQEYEVYDNSGFYSFQVPEWGTWYWIGVWNTKEQYYICGEWVCHFK